MAAILIISLAICHVICHIIDLVRSWLCWKLW